MSAYALIDVHVHDIGRYVEYMREMRPVLEAIGGRYLVRGGEFRVYQGDYQPRRLVVIEFPSLEALETCFNGERCQSLGAAYADCAESRVIGVDGVREKPTK